MDGEMEARFGPVLSGSVIGERWTGREWAGRTHRYTFTQPSLGKIFF